MREKDTRQPHSFDIFELTQRGYKLVWAERRYLLRMLLPVFFIGFVGEITLQILGWQTLFVRRALLMLPAFLAQGWLLSHLVRLVFYDQRWPFRFSGDRERDVALLMDRARGVGGGTLVYALTHYLMNGFMGLLPPPGSLPPQPPDTHGALPVVAMFISLILLGFFIWAFRMLWLHIPVAAGKSMRAYLLALEQRKVASWRLIAVWIICVLPSLFAVLIVEDALSSIFAPTATSPEQLGKGLTFLFVAIEHAGVVIGSLFVTASMALGIKGLLTADGK